MGEGSITAKGQCMERVSSISTKNPAETLICIRHLGLFLKSRVFLGVRKVIRFEKADLLREVLYISFCFNVYADL